MGKKTKHFHVQDIASMYSNMDMIDKFRHGIRFFSTRHEGDVIMEPSLKEERANMDTFGEPPALYFYVHLPIVHKL